MTVSASAAGGWLLERAGVDEALCGDLTEQLAVRQCHWWYWQQVLLAIVALWVSTVRSHKWLALRAVMTGWVVWAMFFLARRLLLGNAAPSADWVAFASTAIRYGNWLVIGWTIGMLHRPHGAPMALMYASFTVLMSVPAVSHVLITVLGHPDYSPPSAAMVVIAVVSLITGGLLSTATARHPQRANPRATHPVIH